MIWMGKKVGGELVVVPHKTILYVMLDGVKRYLRKVGIENKAVETLHKYIDTECLYRSLPWMLFLSFGIVESKNGRLRLLFIINHLLEIMACHTVNSSSINRCH